MDAPSILEGWKEIKNLEYSVRMGQHNGGSSSRVFWRKSQHSIGNWERQQLKAQKAEQALGTFHTISSFVNGGTQSSCGHGMALYERNQGIYQRNIKDQVLEITKKHIPVEMIAKACEILRGRTTAIFSTHGLDSSKHAGHEKSLFIRSKERLRDPLTETAVLVFIACMDYRSPTTFESENGGNFSKSFSELPICVSAIAMLEGKGLRFEQAKTWSRGFTKLLKNENPYTVDDSSIKWA